MVSAFSAGTPHIIGIRLLRKRNDYKSHGVKNFKKFHCSADDSMVKFCHKGLANFTGNSVKSASFRLKNITLFQ